MQTPSVLCAYHHPNTVQTLDIVLIKCNELFKKAEAILSKHASRPEEILLLHQDTESLDHAFISWAKDQPIEWMPVAVGTIRESTAESSTCGYCWQGPVDTYLDCE